MTDSDFETWYYTDEHGLPFWDALLRFPELIERCKSAIDICSKNGIGVDEISILENGYIVMSDFATLLEPFVPATDVKELAEQFYQAAKTIYYATGEKILE